MKSPRLRPRTVQGCLVASILLVVSGSVAEARPDEGPVRIELRTGETVEGELIELRDGVYRVRVGDTVRDVPEVDVARVDLPLPAAPVALAVAKGDAFRIERDLTITTSLGTTTGPEAGALTGRHHLETAAELRITGGTAGLVGELRLVEGVVTASRSDREEARWRIVEPIGTRVTVDARGRVQDRRREELGEVRALHRQLPREAGAARKALESYFDIDTGLRCAGTVLAGPILPGAPATAWSETRLRSHHELDFAIEETWAWRVVRTDEEHLVAIGRLTDVAFRAEHGEVAWREVEGSARSRIHRTTGVGRSLELEMTAGGVLAVDGRTYDLEVGRKETTTARPLAVEGD